MLEKLTLEEAIALFERPGNANKERNHDRRAIASWLKELKELRELNQKANIKNESSFLIEKTST